MLSKSCSSDAELLLPVRWALVFAPFVSDGSLDDSGVDILLLMRCTRNLMIFYATVLNFLQPRLQWHRKKNHLRLSLVKSC